MKSSGSVMKYVYLLSVYVQRSKFTEVKVHVCTAVTAKSNMEKQ